MGQGPFGSLSRFFPDPAPKPRIFAMSQENLPAEGGMNRQAPQLGASATNRVPLNRNDSQARMPSRARSEA